MCNCCCIFSGMSATNRRKSVWLEEDIDKENDNPKRAHYDHEPPLLIPTINSPNANASKEVGSSVRAFGSDANMQPAKIHNRRQSARLLEKKQQQQQNMQQNEDNETANAIDVTQYETIEYVDIVDDENLNNHAAVLHVAPMAYSVASGYKYKPRCELTHEILSLFDRSDPASLANDKLSAVCALCGQRRNYMKGNISNLKTHLKRVNEIINLMKYVQYFYHCFKM